VTGRHANQLRYRAMWNCCSCFGFVLFCLLSPDEE
jgi:hypothetical protein